MKKYLKVFKLSLQDYFVYRTNFFLWRFRSVVTFLALYFFWETAYQGQTQIIGYQRTEMLTYIIGVSVLRNLVLGGRTAALAGMIKTGEVVNKFLTRPWGMIKVWFFRDLASKSINFIFAILELFVLAKILNFPVYFPENIKSILLFIVILLMAILLYFLINFCLSIIAFWVDNIWAPRWLIGVIFLEFMSGRYFPLDVLPNWLFNIIKLTPFPYLIYYPLNIYLGKVGGADLHPLQILSIMFFWLIFFIWFTKKLWKKGLKIYTVYGG